MKFAHLIAAALLIAASGPSFAQKAPIHGQIEKLAQSVLTVKTNEGGDLAITLEPDATVMAMTAASLADVTPGRFVGTAAHPGGPNGELVAIEVHIFADNMRGTGEGHHPMAQGNTMTNATVESAVADVHGRVLTLRYKGGEQKVLVPAKAPIVLLTSSDRAALKPGEHVSFFATRQPDGRVTARSVTVGVNGVIPPL